MIPTWTTLGGDDRAAFWAAVDFLKHRLTESDTIEWALHLRPDRRIERMAVSHLLDSTTGPVLDDLQKDPWATAWRLIQKSWSQASIDEHDSPHPFDIGFRLHEGERSGPIVAAIVNLVTPRLKVEPIDSFRWTFIKKPRRPKKVEHLLSANLTSGHLLDLNHLRLSELMDVSFLVTLANALEATVNHGLERHFGHLAVGFDAPSPIRKVSTRRRRTKRTRRSSSRDCSLGQAPTRSRDSLERTGTCVCATVRSALASFRLSGSHPLVVGTDTEPSVDIGAGSPRVSSRT